ncbi:MAG: hypothetical protein R3282_03025, partial [Rhodothermales bacterium]|nr:hypothetical protein [Rhodothermales bacterium]
MRQPFDFPLSSGGAIGQAILEPLDAVSMRRLVVDVGARNGMLLLPESYTRGAKLVAFEANAEEHAKLVSGETDAVRAGMAPGPRFAEEQYFNCALWDRVERRTLYITAGLGACTLLGATDERVTRRMFLRERHGWSSVPYCDLHTRVKGTMGVDCQPLDSLLPDKKVDFLKLDIVGAEHELPAAADRFRSAEIQPHADYDSSGSRQDAAIRRGCLFHAGSRSR